MSCWNHKWKIISTHYVPHNTAFASYNIKTQNLNFLQQILGNYTVVVQQCEKCGEIKQQKICGKMEIKL